MRLVIGAFATLAEAEAAARALVEAGHRPDEITAHSRVGGGRLLLLDRVPVQPVGDPARLVSRAERARAWAAFGGVAGALLAIVAMLATPWTGVDLLAWAPPPLAGAPAALLTLLLVATVGGALGALARRTDGLPHELANRYGVRLDQGDTVLAVRTTPGSAARAAQEILGMHGAVFAHVTRGYVGARDVIDATPEIQAPSVN